MKDRIIVKTEVKKEKGVVHIYHLNKDGEVVAHESMPEDKYKEDNK